jgi:hypothetical protein
MFGVMNHLSVSKSGARNSRPTTRKRARAWIMSFPPWSIIAATRATRTTIMKLTNNNYIILIGTKNFSERYYRDRAGWLKISASGRTFRTTAEQFLNHVLPAVAGIKPNLAVKVEHCDANVSTDL